MPYKQIVIKEKPTVEQFFEYIEKRQSIFKRRHIDNKPPPWTDDDILRKYRFTNVFRKDDYGTQWAISNIIKAHEERKSKRHAEWNPWLQVFQTIAYRCCNNPDTFDAVGLPDLQMDVKSYIALLSQRQNSGDSVFSSAYRASAFGPTPRLEIYRRILQSAQDEIDQIVDDLDNAPNLEDVHKIFKSRWGIGPFLAYEILSDLMYSKWMFPTFTFNDFIIIGPGAKYGLEMMYGKLNNKEHLNKIHSICNAQHKYLKGWKWEPLTAANIEDNLCEFRKYVSIQNGGGRPRTFVPRKE